MIFNFSDFSLFESRGFAKSLINPSNFIFNFISSKIDWWVNRKGPANYSEEFVFWEDEFGFEKDPDFPIKRFKLKLKILVDDDSFVYGTAKFYRGDVPFHSDRVGQMSLIERGEAIPSMSIRVLMDRKKYKGDIIRLKNNLRALIRHEMVHLYQFFKIKSRDKKNVSVWRNTPISYDFNLIDCHKSETFNDLLDIAYYLMSREEFDASLAEVTAGKSGRVQRNKRLIKKFSKLDPSLMVKNIREEMKEFYPKDNLEEIPKIFLEEYEKDCKKHKVQPLKWALKLRNKSFDDFVLAIHDIVKYRGDKWLKKANKIEYRS